MDRGRNLCFLICLLSHTSSYTIDMTFKVTVVNKFSENILHKGRNGAGVKAELFIIRFDKVLGYIAPGE